MTRKPIPRKGSKIFSLNDAHYRWIAYATPKGTEVRISYEEISDGQMLIAQVPKVFDLRWLEGIVDFALDHGWDPSDVGELFIIRKAKDSYRVITEE